MKIFNWDNEKNQKLIIERNISFEQIVCAIEENHLIDVVQNPNQEKYQGQRWFIVDIKGYCYLVPFRETEEYYFLITIIPSRKYTKKYEREVS